MKVPPLVSLKYLWRVHVGENKGDTGEQVAERDRERERRRQPGEKKKKRKRKTSGEEKRIIRSRDWRSVYNGRKKKKKKKKRFRVTRNGKSASRARHRKHVYPRDVYVTTQVDEPTSTVKGKKRKEGRKEGRKCARGGKRRKRERKEEEKKSEERRSGNSPQSQPGHFELPIPGRV